MTNPLAFLGFQPVRDLHKQSESIILVTGHADCSFVPKCYALLLEGKESNYVLSFVFSRIG